MKKTRKWPKIWKKKSFNPLNLFNLFNTRKKIKFELKTRSKDELEFEDEIDYPADISLKERFKKYKGLKNFRTSEWKKNVVNP